MNQKYKVEKNPNDDSIIYLNVTMTNNKLISVPAEINLTLPDNILNTIDDYFCSIDRFSINGSSIPLRLWKDEYYYVTMKYGTSVVSLDVKYSPNISILSNNTFYEKPIYSYQQLAVMINSCFNTVFTSLKALNPSLSSANPPVFKFNITTGKYEIYAEKLFFNSLGTNTVSLFFNDRLFNLFQNFLIDFISENNTVDQYQDSKIIIMDLGLGLNEVTIGPVTYLHMEQEYVNPASVNEPQLLSIVSNAIGIVPEFILGSSNNPNQLTDTNFGTIPISNVITDFAPQFDNLNQWTNQIVYLPNYRRKHLRKQLPSSRNIDAIVSWSDNESKSYPFLLEPGKSMSIKFVFEKINC